MYSIIGLFLAYFCSRLATADNSAWKSKVLENYDRRLAPELINKEATGIRLAYVPRHILTLDTSRKRLTMDGYLMMKWTDPRLRWKDTDLILGSVSFETGQIWIPEISFFHSTGYENINSSAEDSPAWVNSEGRVSYYRSLSLSFPCQLKPEYFPDDTATCNHYFGLLSSTGREVKVWTFNETGWKLSPEDVTGGEWRLESYSYNSYAYHYDQDEDGRNYVNMTLTVRRSPSAYKLNSITLLVRALLLTIAVFVIEARAVKSRYVVAVSNYLLVEFYFLSIGPEIAPAGGWPLLARLISGAFGLVSLVLLETMALDVLSRRPTEPPSILETMARLVPEKLVGVEKESGWSFVLRVFDRILFYFLIISYVIFIAVVSFYL